MEFQYDYATKFLKWPFAKFGLKHEDLFTTLSNRFNTQRIPLQNPDAFHFDVCEIAERVDSLTELYEELDSRKEQRAREMKQAWQNVTRLLYANEPLLVCKSCYDPDIGDVKWPEDSLNDTLPQRVHAFTLLASCPSFDNLIRFFDGYVRDDRKKRSEQSRLVREQREREKMERVRRWGEAKFGKKKASLESINPQSDGPSKQQLEAPEKPLQTAEGSTSTATKRKRAEDEDEDKDAKGPKRKGGRVRWNDTIEYDDEEESPASGQDKSGAAGATPPKSALKQSEKRTGSDDSQDEARDKRPMAGGSPSISGHGQPSVESPTLKQGEKRKRTDDAQDGAGNKRPRINDSPTISGDAQPAAESPTAGRFDGEASPTDSNADGLPSAAAPLDHALGLTSEQSANKSAEAPATGSQPPANQELGVIDASQAPPAAKKTASEAADARRARKRRLRAILQARLQARLQGRESTQQLRDDQVASSVQSELA